MHRTVPAQAGIGPDPEKSISRLNECVDRIRRKTIFYREAGFTVAGERLGRVQALNAWRQGQKKKQDTVQSSLPDESAGHFATRSSYRNTGSRL